MTIRAALPGAQHLISTWLLWQEFLSPGFCGNWRGRERKMATRSPWVTMREAIQLLGQLLPMTLPCRYLCAVSPAGVLGLYLPTRVAYRSSYQLGRLTRAVVTNNPQIFVVSHHVGLFFTHATCSPTPGGSGGSLDRLSGTQRIEAP